MIELSKGGAYLLNGTEIIEDGSNAAAELSAKLGNAAPSKEEAAKIVDRAKVEAELEKKKMADEVKREMVAVASVMAAKIVAANIDANTQHELIEETLKEIGDSTWLS